MVTPEQKISYKELLQERKVVHKKVGKQLRRTYLISIIFGAIIGVGFSVISMWGDKTGETHVNQSSNYFIMGFLFLYLFLIIHIILHEAGHLVFGKLTGYQFLSFRIFSIIFYKKDGRIHRKKYSIKGTAGQCLMYPPKRLPDGSYPFILYNLGGGISNLIFSLPFVIPAIYTEDTVLRLAYGVFIFVGLSTFIANVVPMSPGIQNDGMNLISMLKDKNMQDAFYLQLKINAEMSDGKLITDYGPEVFTLPEGSNDTNMLTAFVRLYAYYQQIANHDYQSAEAILADMEIKAEKHQSGILNIIDTERLFLMLLQKRPLEEIASIYVRSRLFLERAKTNIGVCRVRYLYETLLSEEEKIDIMTLIKKKVPKRWKQKNHEKLYQEFLKAAADFPVQGEAAMHVDMVNYIREGNFVAEE